MKCMCSFPWVCASVPGCTYPSIVPVITGDGVSVHTHVCPSAFAHRRMPVFAPCSVPARVDATAKHARPCWRAVVHTRVHARGVGTPGLTIWVPALSTSAIPRKKATPALLPN